MPARGEAIPSFSCPPPTTKAVLRASAFAPCADQPFKRPHEAGEAGFGIRAEGTGAEAGEDEDGVQALLRIERFGEIGADAVWGEQHPVDGLDAVQRILHGERAQAEAFDVLCDGAFVGVFRAPAQLTEGGARAVHDDLPLVGLDVGKKEAVQLSGVGGEKAFQPLAERAGRGLGVFLGRRTGRAFPVFGDVQERHAHDPPFPRAAAGGARGTV